MGDGLGSVHNGVDAARFGLGDERGEVVDGAEGVGDEGGGEDFDAVEVTRQVAAVEFARVVDGQHDEFGTEALAGALPRHDVGVVFEGGEEDFVAGFQDEFA